jgi:hypothetical protein
MPDGSKWTPLSCSNSHFGMMKAAVVYGISVFTECNVFRSWRASIREPPSNGGSHLAKMWGEEALLLRGNTLPAVGTLSLFFVSTDQTTY